jgi:hypothetical protein
MPPTPRKPTAAAKDSAAPLADPRDRSNEGVVTSGTGVAAQSHAGLVAQHGMATLGFHLEDGTDVSETLEDVVEEQGVTTVQVGRNIYVRHMIPNTNTEGTNLLYYKGQTVPLSEIRNVQAAYLAEKRSRTGPQETQDVGPTETKE